MRIVAVIVLGLALPLSAQIPTDSASRSAIVRDSAAGLSWMLEGHRDWFRYTHPAECVAAIEMANMTTIRRTNRVHPVVTYDTLSTLARSTGRRCAEQFTLKNVSPHEWMSFLELALLLDTLPLAHAIIDDQLARARTVDEKGSVVTDALQYFIAREPRHVAAADSLVQYLGSLGPGARWWQVKAAEVTPASPNFAPVSLTERNQASLSRYTGLSHDERMKSGFPSFLIGTTWFAIQEYERGPLDRVCPALDASFRKLGNDTVRGNTAAMFAAAIAPDCEREVARIGQRSAPLTGERWFVPGDTLGTSTPNFPILGHVTFVIPDTLGAGRISPDLAAVARLHDKYGKDGFDVVLVHRRRGYVWGSGLLSPATETRLIRWYDHDYLHLPFVVGVYDSAATDFPHPMLLGRDGRHIVGGMVLNADNSSNESILDAFIRQALSGPSLQRTQ